jgi:hypothetical protein
MLQETSKISNQIVPQGSHQRSKHESDVHNTTPLAMRSMLQLKLIDLFFKKKKVDKMNVTGLARQGRVAFLV